MFSDKSKGADVTPAPKPVRPLRGRLLADPTRTFQQCGVTVDVPQRSRSIGHERRCIVVHGQNPLSANVRVLLAEDDCETRSGYFKEHVVQGRAMTGHGNAVHPVFSAAFVRGRHGPARVSVR